MLKKYRKTVHSLSNLRMNAAYGEGGIRAISISYIELSNSNVILRPEGDKTFS